MIGEFLVYDEKENISMDKISIYSRKLSWQKFHNELACVFTAALRKQKCRPLPVRDIKGYGERA